MDKRGKPACTIDPFRRLNVIFTLWDHNFTS
jgi:hypothetical protein